MNFRSIFLIGITASMLLARTAAGHATEKVQGGVKPVENSSQTEIEKYCINNSTAAVDAHLAWQKRKLSEMEEKLKQTIAELQEKQEEYKKWVMARQELLAKAQDGVAAIFSHMRPDAAASELSAMDDETAAAILAKLNPRNASAILNEIDPPRAARLTDVMTGSAKKMQEAKKSL